MMITRRQLCAFPLPILLSSCAIGQTPKATPDSANVAAAEREGSVLVTFGSK